MLAGKEPGAQQIEAAGGAEVRSEEGGQGDKNAGAAVMGSRAGSGSQAQALKGSGSSARQEGLARRVLTFFFAFKTIIDLHDTRVVNKQTNSDEKRDHAGKILLPSA